MSPLLITVIALASLLVVIILLLLLVRFLLNGMFKKRYDGDVRFELIQTKDFPGLVKEPVKILNDYNVALHGAIFSYPKREYHGVIIFYHGLFCGYNNYLQLIEYFVKHDYIVVAFDFMGNMTSGGESIKGMPIVDHDNKSIINFVINHPRLKRYPLYTMGHSWGAHTAMTSLLHDDKHIKKVVAFNPYNSHIDCTYSIKGFAIVLTPIIYLYYLLCFGYTSTYKVVDAIKYTDNKKLIFCGEVDNVVKSRYGYKKYLKVQDENLDLRYLKGVNHFSYLSDKAASYFAKNVSYPRTEPVDYNSLDYSQINELNYPLLDEVIKFLKE